MRSLGKLLPHHTPDPLRRRISPHRIWMCLLIRQHRMIKSVILFISRDRIVLDIVGVCPSFESLYRLFEGV
jgi:hypothetical protein